MNSKVDWFFSKATQWKEEFEKLRKIILDCGLTEELKWGQACYTLPTGLNKSFAHSASGRAVQNKNIVLIHGFKEYCALLFFKGALLKDTKDILVRQTENVQAARQIRFTDVRQIVKMQKILTKYIYEAIEVEEAGLKVDLKKTKEFAIPQEFQNKMNEQPKLKTAFYSLTPGRQRAYLLYFAQAKQSKTRQSRVEKYVPKILDRKGLDD